MRALRNLLLGMAAVGPMLGSALAAGGAPTPPTQQWSFERIFGTYDLAAAQRGFQVYSEVCAACHSLTFVHYRQLSGIGLTPEQIKAVAAAVTVPQGLDDQGAPKEGPGTPANKFKAPFPNETAARAGNNGAYPPDLSLMVNARVGGPDYIYGLMTGYGTPPGSNRSYRATIYVQDPALDARSLKVALQARGGGAVPVDTQRAVEDAILTRARQLRVQDSNL